MVFFQINIQAVMLFLRAVRRRERKNTSENNFIQLDIIISRAKRRSDAIDRADRHLLRDRPQKSATRFPHAKRLDPRNAAAY